ncbi:hypothetical protein G6F24_015282 [Rhizopus arrhizus]|nr:hypothetical protein G6F24_015282 [Rhizopus arrhizus]
MVFLPRPVDLVVRRRPVDQRQVDAVGAQFFQAGAQAGQQRIVLELGDPHLGGQVQIVARHTRFGDGLADFGFIAIDLRGVDGAVADLQRVAHRVDHGLVLQAEGAETKGGDSHGKLQRGEGSSRRRGPMCSTTSPPSEAPRAMPMLNAAMFRPEATSVACGA